MALKVDADLTDPPAVGFDVETLYNYGAYVVVAGVAFGALSVAQSTVQPVAESLMNMVPGVSSPGGNTDSRWEGL